MLLLIDADQFGDEGVYWTLELRNLQARHLFGSESGKKEN